MSASAPVPAPYESFFSLSPGANSQERAVVGVWFMMFPQFPLLFRGGAVRLGLA